MAPRLDKTAQRAMRPCAPEHAFHFANGDQARTVPELRALVAHVDDGVLHHHRTHFHHWLRDVTQDAKLARRFEQAGTDATLTHDALRARLLKDVDARLGEYERALKRDANGRKR